MNRILIIDDELELIEILRDSFQQMGDVQVDISPNGFDAYLLADKNAYDLICTDYNMPVMNGGDFVEAIRQRSVNNAKTPILMITGGKPEIGTDDEKWTNVYFLEKPVEFDQLKRYFNMSCVNKKKVG